MEEDRLCRYSVQGSYECAGSEGLERRGRAGRMGAERREEFSDVSKKIAECNNARNEAQCMAGSACSWLRGTCYYGNPCWDAKSETHCRFGESGMMCSWVGNTCQLRCSDIKSQRTCDRYCVRMGTHTWDRTSKTCKALPPPPPQPPANCGVITDAYSCALNHRCVWTSKRRCTNR